MQALEFMPHQSEIVAINDGWRDAIGKVIYGSVALRIEKASKHVDDDKGGAGGCFGYLNLFSIAFSGQKICILTHFIL